MSICEKIAQVAQDKIATARDLLRSLIIKEQMSKSLGFFEQIAKSLFYSQNKQFTKKNLNKIIFFVHFFGSLKIVSNSLIPSFLKSDVSELLRSLMTKERL